VPLSLDEMRARMVRWKEAEILRAGRELTIAEQQGLAARAAAALVLESRPHLARAVGASCARSANVGQWRCIDGSRGVAYLEENLRRARAWAKVLDEESARRFLATTDSWLREGNQNEQARARNEIDRTKREKVHFEKTLRDLSAPSSASDDADAAGGPPACIICLDPPTDPVGVLPCGHCVGCAPCVRQWINQAAACPTCRRPARLQDVSFVALRDSAAAAA